MMEEKTVWMTLFFTLLALCLVITIVFTVYRVNFNESTCGKKYDEMKRAKEELERKHVELSDSNVELKGKYIRMAREQAVLLTAIDENKGKEDIKTGFPTYANAAGNDTLKKIISLQYEAERLQKELDSHHQ